MSNTNIFDETVKTLTEDAQSLQKKFSTFQEKNDFHGALDCMRLLKDTLSLIKEYDWQLMYSEYETDGHRQVSVWKQNHAGEIKDTKVWDITASNDIMYIDFSDKKALVFFQGKRYALDYLPIGKNNRIPLIDFIHCYAKNCKIYVDNRGFGKAITDILDDYKIPYGTMSCHRFLDDYYYN